MSAFDLWSYSIPYHEDLPGDFFLHVTKNYFRGYWENMTIGFNLFLQNSFMTRALWEEDRAEVGWSYRGLKGGPT
jgi:hypothetical protein